MTTSSRRAIKARRRVRFPEQEEDLGTVVCQVINRQDLSNAERHELWYGPTDYETGKASARSLTIQCGMSKNLDQVFLEKKTHEAQNKLNEWSACEDSLRGLEKWCNPCLGEARQNAVFEAVMEVLRVYDTLKFEHGQADEEEVRRTSSKCSKASRVFARMIAKADAVAVGQDYRVHGADDAGEASKHVRSSLGNSNSKSKSSKHHNHDDGKNSKKSGSSPSSKEGDSLFAKRIGAGKRLFGLGKARIR